MVSTLQSAHQWMIREDDIAVVADAYGLVLDPRTAKPLGGAVNGVSCVSGTTGDVVLRVHRPWATVARLEAVHRVQTRLRAYGLPIPDILTNRDGRAWTRLHDRLVEVMAYLPGGHEADCWPEFAISFAMLGRVHAALASLDPTAVPAPAYCSYVDPATALAVLTETDDAFASCAECDEYDAANASRNDARQLWRLIHTERTRYEEALPRSFVHADFVGKNVLLAHDQVIALLDFDRLAYRERVFDLAVSAFCALGRLYRTRSPDDAPTAHDLGELAHVLAAYEAAAHRTLTSAEIDALPFEMARTPLFPITDAGYLAAAGNPVAAVAQTRSVSHLLPRAHWLVTHAHLIHQALQCRHPSLFVGTGQNALPGQA